MSINKTKTANRQRQVQSLAESMRRFLTPSVWKQAHRARRRGRTPRSSRWKVEPLVMVLLLFTWCHGDSVSECFEAARGFYILSHARRRRPGRGVEGFQKALAKLPVHVLRNVAFEIQRRMAKLFAPGFKTAGWNVFGVDGTRLECPRTAELEQRIGTASKKKSAPMLWVTAIVHLRLGLLWAWRVGKARASEREHAVRLLSTLPQGALLVADAGFNGYGLAQAILDHKLSFLIRMSAKVTLLVEEKLSRRAREAIVYYWPQHDRHAGRPALKLRLLRLRGKKKRQDVWLLTNVLDSKRLPLEVASQFYRWRWENEGLFRTYKRTLKKVKLLSRTVRLVHREAEGALLATQLLLAQGTLAVNFQKQRLSEKKLDKCSPRQVLLEIRKEIYGSGKRRKSFGARLQQASREERQRQSAKEKRPWPRPNKNHKPPKPPKIRELNSTEKRVLDQQKLLESG